MDRHINGINIVNFAEHRSLIQTHSHIFAQQVRINQGRHTTFTTRTTYNIEITLAFKKEFTLTLIETLNEEVLKTVYGSDNVTTALEGKDITVAVNGGSDEESVYVFALILKDGALKRIVVPL